MSIKLGTTSLAGTNEQKVTNAYTLGEYKWTDHKLNRADWLRSDTFSWQSGEVYQAMYNHLFNDIQGKTLKQDFIDINAIPTGNCYFDNEKFTGSNGAYATLPIKLPLNIADSWEFQTCYYYNGGGSYPTVFSTSTTNGYNAPLFDVESGVFRLFLSSNGTSWDMASGVTTLSAITGKTYYFKVGFTGEEYYVKYNLDGSENYQTVYSLGNSTKVFNNSNMILLNYGPSTGSYYNNGTMDMSKTRWLINGQVAWEGTRYINYYQADDGHKIAPPSEENKIQSNFLSQGCSYYYILDVPNTRFKLPRVNHGSVIKTGQVGLDKWYKIWSDGYCEQWGVWRSASSSYNAYFVTFPKKFKDLNYYANVQVSYQNNDLWCAKIGGKYVQGIQFYYVYNQSGYANWEAKGYLDKSQYEHYLDDSYKRYLYFYVGEFSQSALEQTAGITTEQLNQKVDKSDMKEIYPVIETYKSGDSWYRVYSDGWCEQGSRITESGVNAVNIQFMKSYKEIPSLLTTECASNRTSYLDNNIDVFNLTTNGFTKQYIANVGTGWTWEAKGYLPEGDF